MNQAQVDLEHFERSVLLQAPHPVRSFAKLQNIILPLRHEGYGGQVPDRLQLRGIRSLFFISRIIPPLSPD